jgi:outer membrane protein assembly factor BamA
MIKLFQLSFVVIGITTVFQINAQESEPQKSFAIAPIISSSPTMGTGLGATSSYLYKMGDKDPTSQLVGLAQYTDTNSYVAGLMNNMYLDEGNQRAMTAAWYVNVNNDFNGAEFVNEGYGVFHRQSWQIANNWFLGGQVIAQWNNFSADNAEGEDFLELTDASDSAVYGVGAYLTYDTRDNFYYPLTGSLFEATTVSYLDALGSDVDYDMLELTYTRYLTIRDKNVLALGYYGRYVSDDAPYSGESYLGRRSALRGFSAGEISGQRLTALQGEYRYHFSEKWKFIGFAGVANIQEGTAEKSGQDGLYYSAGVGVRYAIQPKDKVHLRLDIAFGNDDNQGFYIGLQEAF